MNSGAALPVMLPIALSDWSAMPLEVTRPLSARFCSFLRRAPPRTEHLSTVSIAAQPTSARTGPTGRQRLRWRPPSPTAARASARDGIISLLCRTKISVRLTDALRIGSGHPSLPDTRAPTQKRTALDAPVPFFQRPLHQGRDSA